MRAPQLISLGFGEIGFVWLFVSVGAVGLAVDRLGGRVVGPNHERPGSRFGRPWGLGRDILAAIGIGGGVGARLVGLALVAAQVG